MTKQDEVKEIITEAVLEFLNEGVTEDRILAETQLNYAQEVEIKRLVTENTKRPGFLSFTYGSNRDNDSSYLGVRVDPQNTKNWARSKEEVIFRAPYRLAEAIETFTKSLLNEQRKS